jgi:pSer/pThr/pTyr-binding forkhead associated (FHA) protein
MYVRFRVVQGRPVGKRLLFPGGEFLFGRGPECHIRPDSDWVSRQHCMLRVDGQGAFLRDLGSRNGTLVNGERLVGERQLSHRDEVQVGPLMFEVELEETDPTRSSEAISTIPPKAGTAEMQAADTQEVIDLQSPKRPPPPPAEKEDRTTQNHPLLSKSDPAVTVPVTSEES